MRLEGRVAVITAAGSGMGRASAELFASEGAHVIVVDRDLEAAEKTCGAIHEAGGAASPERVDVSKVEELRSLFDRLERDHGVVHVLFNHAGTPGAGGLDITEEQWQQSIDVNMKGAFFATSFALPLLRRAGGHGSVIFTSSVSGLVGSPLSPLYSMAKGGVILFMKGFALMVAKEGIRANAICPGPIDTPMLPLFFGRAPGTGPIEDEVRGFIAQAVPAARPGQPFEIASAALFLASDESSYVTGVALPVDGGYTAR